MSTLLPNSGLIKKVLPIEMRKPGEGRYCWILQPLMQASEESEWAFRIVLTAGGSRAGKPRCADCAHEPGDEPECRPLVSREPEPGCGPGSRERQVELGSSDAGARLAVDEPSG